jgi:GTP-sensing pleiotropic transcriptional regulator CodY
MQKDDLKKLYEVFYLLSVEISKLIDADNFNEVAILLNKKDELIAKINEIKSQLVFSEQEKIEFNNLANKIKEIEDKNIQLMENKQDLLKQTIFKTNKVSKTISSYKVKKEIEPNYFDERE